MSRLHDGRIILHHGDCLDVMHEIPDGSVDAIICDLPYGTTACKWDVVIPFEPMWAALKRIIKPRGAIVLFGSQPFTSALIMSNPKMFRYTWVWDKNRTTGGANANRIPMRSHEDICVFCENIKTYNPQMRKWTDNEIKRMRKKDFLVTPKSAMQFRSHIASGRKTLESKGKYPDTILRIPALGSISKERTGHPTQKPVALLEYLIRTYTNEGETVLDFTFGSCSAGVAALNTKRRFIGIERDAAYYALGVQRVQAAIDNLPPMDV